MFKMDEKKPIYIMDLVDAGSEVRDLQSKPILKV